VKVNEQLEGEVSAVKQCIKCEIEKPLSEFYKRKGRWDELAIYCRFCWNARARVYRQTNRETISIQRKARYQANREALLIRAKVRHEANRAKKLTKFKAYYQANKEMILVKRKDYRQANREVQQFRIKVWRKKNPERNREIVRESKRRRRARLFKAVTVPFTAAMKAAKYADQDGLCYYRNEELNGIYEIEHKIPLCRGGNDIPENIVLACRRCNLEKSRMTDTEFFERIRAESAEKVA
jgi:5-methylcytosine-specific restriction endonuclease McrA